MNKVQPHRPLSRQVSAWQRQGMHDRSAEGAVRSLISLPARSERVASCFVFALHRTKEVFRAREKC